MLLKHFFEIIIYLNFILVFICCEASTFAKQDAGRRNSFIIHVSHLKVTKMQQVAVMLIYVSVLKLYVYNYKNGATIMAKR